MRGKKTAQLAYRLTHEEKEAITKIAQKLKMKPAEIVSMVMAQFIEAHDRYGRSLVWPPEFNYFTSEMSRQDALVSIEDDEAEDNRTN